MMTGLNLKIVVIDDMPEHVAILSYKRPLILNKHIIPVNNSVIINTITGETRSVK